MTVAAIVATTLLWSASPGSASTDSPAVSRPESTAISTKALLPAAPAGKLIPNCTSGTGTATCDLYASPGNTSILGTSVPIWGFSTKDPTTVPEPGQPIDPLQQPIAPGPQLVVKQGDLVTVTLHNQLPGENLSLAFPAQVNVSGSNTPGDDLSGVATGSTRTYTFTAGRPGTFLYEAGHTANGARQVAMGLAGALVVLPADGTAYGATAGYPDSSYDDDAVLVLSEIDPALNANPSTFDMRNFAPKYRMFNGKPFPSADPIATDQNHTVLLRYVNAGSQTHALSLLGGDQVEIAQDGHPMKFASTVTAESVAPGATLDALVKIPPGPEAKLALYEPALHLDNNGQHTDDPLQFAFGGMLTFLDTNAPPPDADRVGPVSSNIRLAPNPSDARGAVTVTADLSEATTGGLDVTQAEFVIDDAVATAVGSGMAMTATFGSRDVNGATGTIPAVAPGPCQPPLGLPSVGLNCLDAGKHTIFVRAQDSSNNWGVVGSAILNLPKTGPQTTAGSVTSSPANGATAVSVSATGDDSAAGGTIIAAEYFIDTVGADGSGAVMNRNRTATVVSESATLAVSMLSPLSEGTHHLLVHSEDSLNLWGPTLDIPLVIDKTGPTVNVADVAPNPSNGILTSKSNPGYLTISASITDKDAGGAVQSVLRNAEAFLDPKVATPPGGTGLQLIAVDGKLDSTTESVYGLLPVSQVKALTNGVHHVYVRGQDIAGNWGALFPVNLLVDKVAPVLGALAGSPNPTNGATNLTLTAPLTETNGLGAAEFWLGTTDPGVGKGTRISASVVGTDAVAMVPLVGIAIGTQRFNLRVQDQAGNWSNAVNTSVTVSKPNAIFTGLFEVATSPYGWTSATAVNGSVSTSTTAKLPSVVEPGSTMGLAATVGTIGGPAGRLSFVSDMTPAAETSYHAQFVFNRNTLTSGAAANVLTIFEGRAANNNQVFAVQFRMSGPTPQVRPVLVRNNGPLNGPWVNLSNGQHILQVDWVTGTNGSLVLKVDAAAQPALTGNTGTRAVETAVLGVTAGTTNGTNPPTGTAWFDSFVSTRFTL